MNSTLSKHRYLAIGFGLLAICALEAKAQTSKEDLEECKRMEHSAKLVMESRQSDVPMSTLWEIAEKSDSEYIKEMYKLLISSAYDKPRYSVEENQQKAVIDFQNSFFSACMRNAGKRKKS